MSRPLNRPQQPWIPNEFVVALPHLAVVLAELDSLPQPVRMPKPQESPDLDLALITIDNVDEVAGNINRLSGPSERCVCTEYAIDRVIRAVRDCCRRQYGGWVPTIGKNRMLDGVHTTQHVGTGSGADYPTPAARTELGDLSTDETGDRALVGLIDTALWVHPELKGRYREAESNVELSPSDWYWESEGHATFVAGMILQDSPNVELVVRKGLDPDGTAKAWDVAGEMVQLAKRVDVLNISFACFTDDDQEPLLLARAIEMIGSEKVIVAAAGNFADSRPRYDRRSPNSPRSPMWPAASSRVIAVGAHLGNGERAAFSPDVPWVDLSACGVDVASLYLNGMVKFREYEGGPPQDPMLFDGYAAWTGTSFAAAVASGAIARRIRRGPTDITARQALDQVLDLPAGNPENVWRYQRR